MTLFKRVIIIFISVFFILGLKAQGNDEQDIEILIDAFRKTNAELELYWLHVGIPYKKILNDSQLLSEGKKLSSIFLLPESDNLKKINNQNLYYSFGSWGYGTEAELILKRVNEQTNETYLLFRLKGVNSLDDLKVYYELLSEKMLENQISPKINSCIQGKINDKLGNTEQFVLINKILKSINADRVEMLNTDLVKSVSAYSSKIKNYIWTSNNKMNVQISTHFDSLNKKTILTLGTPIITIEY